MGIVTRTDVVRQMAFCQGCGCTAAAATVMTKDVHVAQYLADHERAEAFARPIIDEDLTPLGVINARMLFSFCWRDGSTKRGFCVITSWALDVGEVTHDGQ